MQETINKPEAEPVVGRLEDKDAIPMPGGGKMVFVAKSAPFGGNTGREFVRVCHYVNPDRKKTNEMAAKFGMTRKQFKKAIKKGRALNRKLKEMGAVKT
jgi:hypothetical protein